MDDSPYTRLNSRPAWNVAHLLVVSFGFTGLATLHQFPRYLYAGSGAFLLPYFLCLVWLSVPVLYVQFRLGGITGSNITGIVAKHLPILKGISIACGLRLLYGAVVHQVETAIALYYLYVSFTDPPKWSSCENSWNTEECGGVSPYLTDLAEVSNWTPEGQFFGFHIIKLSDGFFDTGGIIGHLAVSMLVVWIVTFLLVAWGPRAYAWIISVPVAVGLLISFVLLGRLWSTSDDVLSSAFTDLLKKFYKADWDAVKDIDVWRAALRNQINTMFLWLGVIPTLGKYSGPGNVLSRGGWFFILQAVVFVQHITVCLFIPFIALQTPGAMKLWPVYNFEEFMFAAVPVSLGSLPDELWPRAITSLFYTYVVIFSMLSSALVVFVVVSMLVSGISALSGPKSTWEKAALFRPIITAIVCFVSYLLGIAFVSQSGYYWRMLSDMIQDKFLFLYVLILAIPLTVAFVRETSNYIERVVIGVWFVLASVISLIATLYDGKPWELLDQYKSILPTNPIGSTDLSNDQPKDGDNVVAVSYTIVLGPLVWGLIIGAIHAVVSYNGPSELKCSYLLTGWRSGNALGRGRAAENTHPPPAVKTNSQLRNSIYPSLTTH